ncbi:transposase [Novosphingobium sp. ES2-1]|uniref:IS66 family transposase n=1 Tax=Novosphingobium sp. ES2-1 TaxID=2780074 RepID=UPI001E32EECB|nr:transposase [Novosphingobium sp. ES2-1]
MYVYLEARLRHVSSNSHPAVAIRHAPIVWPGLSLLLDGSRVKLASNTFERSIGPLLLSRKKALLAGSDESGDDWAVIPTLIENCKMPASTGMPR